MKVNKLIKQIKEYQQTDEFAVLEFKNPIKLHSDYYDTVQEYKYLAFSIYYMDDDDPVWQDHIGLMLLKDLDDLDNSTYEVITINVPMNPNDNFWVTFDVNNLGDDYTELIMQGLNVEGIIKNQVIYRASGFCTYPSTQLADNLNLNKLKWISRP